MQLNIVDVSLAQDQSGEPRLNLGDVTTGKGFASGVPCWGSSDGFISIPNGPDGGQAAPQALMITDGMQRYALAVRDPRWVGKQGQLAEGDRAIVSNCDAGMLLSKSQNKLTLSTTRQTVTLDGNGGISLVWADGAGTTSRVDLLNTGAYMTFITGGQTASIQLTAAGTVAIICTPGAFTVNGVPVVVP